jgi:hypothetical protein
LLEAVWSDVMVGDAALTVCVAEIRKALGDAARTPRVIETVHRRGYRFIGRAGSMDDQDAPAPLRQTPGTPIVGRARELGTLGGWLARARQGDRQVGFVTGEAGIGKTALVDAFLASVPAGDCQVGRGQCLDHYGAGEAYLPVLEAVSRLARGPDGDPVLAALTRHAPTWLVQMPGLVEPADIAALQPRVVAPRTSACSARWPRRWRRSPPSVC